MLFISVIITEAITLLAIALLFRKSILRSYEDQQLEENKRSCSRPTIEIELSDHLKHDDISIDKITINEQEFGSAYDRLCELIVGCQKSSLSDGYDSYRNNPQCDTLEALCKEAILLETPKEMQDFVYEKLTKFILKGK